jgi:hypothetical protein
MREIAVAGAVWIFLLVYVAMSRKQNTSRIFAGGAELMTELEQTVDGLIFFCMLNLVVLARRAAVNVAGRLVKITRRITGRSQKSLALFVQLAYRPIKLPQLA